MTKKLYAIAMFLAFACAAFADPLVLPCKDGLTTLPEGSLEAEVSITCTGFSFGANAGIWVFMEPDGVTPSDIVTLSDVEGVATIDFISDLDVSLGLPSSPFQTVTEPGTFSAFAALSNISSGNVLEFTFSSDTNESSQTSDSILIGAPTEVPEPSACLLLGAAMLSFVTFRVLRRRRSRAVN